MADIHEYIFQVNKIYKDLKAMREKNSIVNKYYFHITKTNFLDIPDLVKYLQETELKNTNYINHLLNTCLDIQNLWGDIQSLQIRKLEKKFALEVEREKTFIRVYSTDDFYCYSIQKQKWNNYHLDFEWRKRFFQLYPYKIFFTHDIVSITEKIIEAINIGLPSLTKKNYLTSSTKPVTDFDMLIINTIKEYLNEFEPIFKSGHYDVLVEGLKEFFEGAISFKLEEKIKFKEKINKKILGKQLRALYYEVQSDYENLNEKVPYSYYDFLKINIAIFSDTELSEKNLTGSQLYKILHS